MTAWNTAVILLPVYAYKLAQNWHIYADDKKNIMCYNNIMYKWVRGTDSLFKYDLGRNISMKYCPFCGAVLPDEKISFCLECGEKLSDFNFHTETEKPSKKAKKEKKKEKN